MNSQKFVLIYILLLATFFSSAQLPKGFYIESGFHIGKSIKHRPNINIDFPGVALGTEINLEVKTYGNKDWHQANRFPRWGLALLYLHSGNNEEMGSFFGFLPNISVDFLKLKKIRIFGRLGVGLGIVTNPYDKKYNPNNNMVGSYLNNVTALRLGLAIHLTKNIELRPSASFTHFSNGASTLPNLGINIPTFQLSLCYKYNPVSEFDYPEKKAEKWKMKWKPQYSFIFSAGMKEYDTFGSGLKYPVVHTMVDFGFYFSSNNLLKIGFEYDYIGAYHAHMRHNGAYDNLNLTWQSSRLSIVLSDEIFIGRFSINAGLGFYLTQNLLQPWFMSIRLAGKYYFCNPLDKKISPFIYISIKAHKFVAEYFSVGFGTKF